jgi:hypothetical protein
MLAPHVDIAFEVPYKLGAFNASIAISIENSMHIVK